MITQEQLKELQQRKEDLKHYLDIDGKKIEVEEEELRTHVPDFWQDQKAAEAQMKKIKSLRNWINGCEEVELAVDEVATGFDFVKEGLVEESELDTLYSKALAMLEKLELPWHILRLCGGDMSFTSAITFDFEVWSAAQQKWLEVSSVSNFETFQANRMKLRFKDSDGKTKLAHTLNGSALALPRIVAALLENNQTPDGIIMPECLRPYLRFDKID